MNKIKPSHSLQASVILNNTFVRLIQSALCCIRQQKHQDLVMIRSWAGFPGELNIFHWSWKLKFIMYFKFTPVASDDHLGLCILNISLLNIYDLYWLKMGLHDTKLFFQTN